MNMCLMNESLYQVRVKVADKKSRREDYRTAGLQTTVDVHKRGSIVFRPCGKE